MDTTSSPALGRRPPLTGIRGIAVLMVLLQHLAIGPVDDARGVDIFFVLSGFLITNLLLEEMARRGRLGYKRFYLRRVVRLYPALLAMVVVTFVAFTLVASDSWRSSVFNGAFASLTYTTNIARGVFRAPVQPFEHTWSVAVEEQFYLIWPLVLTGLVALTRGRPGRLVAAVVALIGADLLYGVWYYGRTADYPHLYVGLDGRGVQLLIGCLLGVLFHQGRLDQLSEATRTRLLPVLGWLSLAGLTGLMVWHPFGASADVRSSLGMLDLTVSGVAAGFLVLAVVTAPSSRLARLLSLPLVLWIGLVSYSLYLWHVPVLWFVTQWDLPFAVHVALITVGSFGLAAASWYLIERPLGRWREHVPALGGTPRPAVRPPRVTEDPRPAR